MQLLAPYNTKVPEKSDILQLFHVYNGDTVEGIKKALAAAVNPNFKLVICTAYPGEDKLMENLRSIGFVEMTPQILRVPLYGGSKVKLFVLKGKV